MVLVTGGLGAIGRAVCDAITAEGGVVLAADIAEGADISLDVTSEASWDAARAAVEAAHGRLDGLVNNAGLMHVGSIEDTSFADWRRVMAVNADGPFLGCKAMWGLLRRSAAPSIVNLSSVSGLVGGAKLVAYNASKGAVRLMTKSVALHGAREAPPIRCNSVHPAFVESPMVDGIAAEMRDPATAHAKLRAMVPLGRMATAADVAEQVVHLLSPASGFATGAEFVLDGGLTAQ